MNNETRQRAIETAVHAALVALNARVAETGPAEYGSSELRRAVVIAARAIGEAADFWGVPGVLATTGLALHAVMQMHLEPLISDVDCGAPDGCAWDVAWAAEARRAADSVMAAHPRAVIDALK